MADLIRLAAGEKPHEGVDHVPVPPNPSGWHTINGYAARWRGTLAFTTPCFFESAFDREWIVKCARTAALHDETTAMPMAYGSLAGDMGSALSGGQKQRVLLVRALYRRPKILLLDEGAAAPGHRPGEADRRGAAAPGHHPRRRGPPVGNGGRDRVGAPRAGRRHRGPRAGPASHGAAQDLILATSSSKRTGLVK